MIIADNAREYHDEITWSKLGTVISTSTITQPGQLDIYDAIYIPFMDFVTLTEVANGLFHSEAAIIIHHALMSNKPVISLNYNCNPASELNQIKGLNRGSAVNDFRNIEKTLIQKGMSFSSLDEMIDKQSTLEKSMPLSLSKTSHYITLSEVTKKNGDYSGENRLTDLAREYLREKSITHK